MPRYRRTDRLNELLRQEISVLLRTEVRDPRTEGATITAVKASPELDHARVFVTAIGDEAEKRAAVEGLNSASSYIRGLLGQRLHIRRVPELHFEVDVQLDEARRIEELLRQVQPSDRPEEDDQADTSDEPDERDRT